MSKAANPHQRLWLLSVSVLGLFVVLALRLADLQIIRSSYYEAVAQSQRQRGSELAPARGTIYMADGRRGELFPVASNRQGYIAYAVPRDMPDPEHVSRELAPALHAFKQRMAQRVEDIMNQTGQRREHITDASEVDDQTQIDILRDQLYQKFNQRTDPYEPLLKPFELLDDELKQFLDEKQLTGLVVAERNTRAYPENSLAAHVLGYVGWEEDGQVGRYGIEEHFHDKLAGNLGWLFSETDTTGSLIGSARRDFKAPEDGADIVLTLDRVVQSIVEEELKSGVERFNAERGSVIVMNPKTGAVLGMATYPTYDLNFYYAIADARVQSNPVVSDQFEPGSILKPVVMAAAIEEGIVEPDTTMNDTGPVKVDKYTINTYDGRHWGTQTMTQILEQSNNVGMVWVGQKLDKERLYDYARRFGAGERTGVELAGETNTNLPPPGEWNVATVATVSFGQGIAVTPLQALNAINVLANKGTLMQPYITTQHQPTSVRHVISASTAAKVSAMMASVIENGVGGSAKVPGYYLAGKTGTAQVANETGGYSDTKKIISFAGFGPLEDPQFSILVKLDNPAGLSFASGTAAPMFRNIAEKLLNYYQIPPSYDPAQSAPAFQIPTNSASPDA